MMKTSSRYPLDLRDESDSDAELFVVPDQTSRRVAVFHKPSAAVNRLDQKGGGDKGATDESNGGTEDVMRRSVLQPGYEQLEAVPKGGSRVMQKRRARLERAKTTGTGWFNMAAPEMTEEVKQNLEVLQMRSAINKNRVYKKNDMRVLPKYFAMGTVVEHAADFYSSRIPKKQRKKTLVDELMADVEAKKQLKKKASKLAVKKQLQAQNYSFKKKKPFKNRQKNRE